MGCCNEFVCQICGIKFKPVKIYLQMFPYVKSDGKTHYTNDKYIIDRTKCLSCIQESGLFGPFPRLYPLENNIQT